jgi:hypothetical protein
MPQDVEWYAPREVTGSDRPSTAPTGVNLLVPQLEKGRRLAPRPEEPLRRWLGADRIGLEGFSRLFQTRLPGVRVFATDVQRPRENTVETTLIGVARNGQPAWHSQITLAESREGALEIHLGPTQIEAAFKERAVLAELIERSLEVLRAVNTSRQSRITTDAEGVRSYEFALHGFDFADKAPEGAPLSSKRALAPAVDLQNLQRSANSFVSRLAEQDKWPEERTAVARQHIDNARTPLDFARLPLPRSSTSEADRSEDPGTLGQLFLLSKDTSPWRGALLAHDHPQPLLSAGVRYRQELMNRAESRQNERLNQAIALLDGLERNEQVRSLETIGLVGTVREQERIRAISEGDDRRLAAVARRALEMISGQKLSEEIETLADDPEGKAPLRARAYRILAEHFPPQFSKKVSMLRVHPDARLQRTVIPYLQANAQHPGPPLASLLGANPWAEGGTSRSGLLELRLELIECLAQIRDPACLPVLIAAYGASPSPTSTEMLALSRALLGFQDPRAQNVLSQFPTRADRLPSP